MLWQSLWDGVRDAEMPLNDFITVALNNAPLEKDYTLLGDVLGKVSESKAYLDAMNLDNAYTRQTTLALEKMAWDGVLANKGNADFQRRWFNQYLSVASSPDALTRLAGILGGQVDAGGVPVGQPQRWSIIARLNRYNYPGAFDLIAQESARDKSDAGQIAAVAATVIRPDAAVKADWVKQIEDQKTALPFSRIRTAMGSIFPAEQGALNERDADARLARLPQVDKTGGPVFMRAYADTMIPATCTPQSVARLSRAAATMTDLSAFTRRTLLDTLQDDQRCVAIKAKLSAPKG
jgi:aminopeptidase N